MSGRRVRVLVADLELAERLGPAAALSEQERARAARFVHPVHRRRFVAFRSLLRLLLGRELDRDPASLRFELGPEGKPALPGCDLRFNLSHSGDLVAFALAEGREVGVDVEELRPVAEGSRIAERYFTPREAEALRGLPESEGAAAFLVCWARKEACVKALGRGLGFGLARIEVGVGRTEERCARAVAGHDGAAVSVRDLALPSGYVGAVAAEGDGLELAEGRWE